MAAGSMFAFLYRARRGRRLACRPGPADTAAMTTAAAEAPSTLPDVFCPWCGYDLRGRVGEACPECGGRIDREELLRSQIPWSHRRTLGRIRAFWQTVWLVTFHT